MNNPIQTLYDEHDIIKSVVDTAGNTAALIGEDNALYEKTVRKLLEFFRSYADKYHHHKEELILFPEMSKKNELLQNGVIQEMLENHSDFREMLKSIDVFLDKKDYMHANQQLNIYCEALLDHIAVENDEVFQMAESLFGEDELEKLFFRFNDSDHELGDVSKSNLVKMAADLRMELVNSK